MILINLNNMKTLNRIWLIVASVIAIVGCVNEMPAPQEEQTGTHTVTFTAEKDIDTKTSVVEEGTIANYYWNEDDAQYFHVYENGVEARSVTMSLSSNNKIATLTATFANSNAETYSYRATYGSDLANSTPHNPLIPYNQSPCLDSFDPAADVLVSTEDIVLDNNAAANETTTFRFKLGRVVSINKMTLKGLTPGETIKTVKLSSSDGYFSSRYMINSTTSYTGEKHWLLFDYTSLDNATVDADGNFPVYFTSAPVTNASFSVDVTTDQHVYSRDNFTSKLTLSVGTFRRFGINLEDYGEDIVAGTVYTLVESQDDLCDGASYLLVGQADNVYYAMADQTDNNRAATAVQRNGNTITIDNTSSAHVFTIENTTTGYTIADNDGSGYLTDNGTSSKNKVNTVANLDDDSYWTITINSNSNSASITNTHNEAKPYLRFNNDNKLFACYESLGSQHPIYLYIDLTTAGPVKQNPELSFDEESYVFTCGDANYNDFSGQTLNNPHNLSVTWESSNTGLAIVNNGVVSFVANATGVTTISASFEGDDTYKSGSASYTITVNPASTVLTLPFTETFDESDGVMGWSGTGVANGTIAFDNDDWVYEYGYGADGAARFGKGSNGKGYAQTPEIYYAGNATLTFKAGAWNGSSESTTLNLSLSGGTIYLDASLSTSVSSVTMQKGAWTEYTLYLKDLTSPFTLKFEGNDASNSRFFLDDIHIEAGIEQPAPQFGAELTNNENVSAAGGTRSISITGNVEWTATVTSGEATVSPSSGTGAGSVTVTIPANNSSQNTPSYVVTVSTTADVTPNSYEFTINQNASTTVGSGTQADPYTAGDILNTYPSGSGNTFVYVTGTITDIDEVNTGYGNATYTISDGVNSILVYRGKYLNNSDFSSADQIKVNDVVVVYGKIGVYNSTPQLAQGNYIYSLNGKTKVLTAGSLEATPNHANKQITVTWGAATGTESTISYEITCGTQTFNATAAGNHTFTMTDYVTYDISVVASASDAIPATATTSVTLTDPSSNTKDYYKMVTNIDDITSGTYVVGALRSTTASNNFYFGKANVSSGDWVVSDNYITVTASNGVRKFETKDLPSGAVEFTLTGTNSSGFTICNGSNYLYFTENSNRKLAFAAAGSTQKWKVNFKSNPLITGGVYLSAVGNTTYTISENSTATGAIRGYASTTAYRAIYLFKKVTE